MLYGAIAGLLARAFPANIRYTGLSLAYQAYQLCSLVVGGGTPVLAQWILNSTGGITWVAITGGIYAVVSLSCTLALLKRTGYDATELSVAERSDEAELGPGIRGDTAPTVARRDGISRSPTRSR